MGLMLLSPDGSKVGGLLIRHKVSRVLCESWWNITFAAAAVSRWRAPHNE